MDVLKRRVRSAWRRLFVQTFARHLAWWWCGCFAAAAVALFAARYFLASPPSWQMVAGGAALGGLFAALATALWKTPSLERAAVELDRRLGLAERVSSALALSWDDVQSPMGRALLADAAARVEKADLRGRFPLELRTRHAAFVGPLAALILVGLQPWASGSQPKVDPTPQPPLVAAKKVEEVFDAQKKKLEEQRKKLAAAGIPDAEALIKKLEEELAKQNEKKPQDRQAALVKLNDLAKQLAEKQQRIGSPEQFQKQLQQLKPLGEGPAEKLAQAMQDGKFGEAAKELEKLREKLADDKLKPEEKAALAKQLGDMQDKMKKAAEAQAEAKKQIQKQIDQAKQEGNAKALEQAMKQLDQLAKTDPQMKQLQELAKQLGQCEKCMKNGDGQGAAEQLAQAKAQLEKMAEDAKMQELLADLNEQLGDMKEQLAQCDACQGGKGDEPGEKGKGQGQGKGQGKGEGDGLGAGRGSGARPEQENATKSIDRQVRQKPDEGRATVVGFVDGPNTPGKVAAQIQAEMEAPRRDSADAGAEMRLPPGYRKHLQEYFDALRE